MNEQLMVADNLDEVRHNFQLYMMMRDKSFLWQATAAAERLLTGLKFLQASSK